MNYPDSDHQYIPGDGRGYEDIRDSGTCAVCEREFAGPFTTHVANPILACENCWNANRDELMCTAVTSGTELIIIGPVTRKLNRWVRIP